MSDTYVLVHGAWHTGAELEAAAAHLRKAGHTVHCPTLAGNRPGDDRATSNLTAAAKSLADYIREHKLDRVKLAGHSYGGMVISQAYQQVPERIARLIYVNAFVPMPGECLNNMVPPMFVQLFDQIAQANNNAIVLPFPIWREAFINDADLALATAAYEKLNPQPYATFTEKATLAMAPHEWPVAKSYVNCVMDAALPHSLPWHPRLSERLGLFRYVECSGSHEVWFTDPEAIARALVVAGRD
jgi:pimeloyl-ACP methyl ester carboxylesterase